MVREALEDERRWAEAESILRRRPTPSAQNRVRRRRRLVLLGLCGALLLGALAGAVIAAFTDGRTSGTTAPTWNVIAGLVCVGLSLVLIIWVVVVQIRSGVWGGVWRSPTVALTRSQRKDLFAQVRGKRPADPARLPLSRDLARRLVLQQRTIALFAALMLQWVGQTLTAPDMFHLVGIGVFLLLSIVAIPIIIRDTGRAKRFLAKRPSL